MLPVTCIPTPKTVREARAFARAGRFARVGGASEQAALVDVARLDELREAAVGRGLVVVGRGARDPEMVDLGLVVAGAEGTAAVVAQRPALHKQLRPLAAG